MITHKKISTSRNILGGPGKREVHFTGGTFVWEGAWVEVYGFWCQIKTIFRRSVIQDGSGVMRLREPGHPVAPQPCVAAVGGALAPEAKGAAPHPLPGIAVPPLGPGSTTPGFEYPAAGLGVPAYQTIGYPQWRVKVLRSADAAGYWIEWCMRNGAFPAVVF